MKKNFFYLITILIPFFLSLLLFIGYLRFSYIIVPFKVIAHYELKLKISTQNGYYKFEPGIYENMQMGSVFSINSDGFRGKTQKSDLNEKYSIVALGESSTMGIEVNDDYTWPELLDNLLNAKGIPAAVFNAGVGGINSTQMVALYKAEIQHLQPKVIIYYAGRNDHGLGGGLTRFPGPEKWPAGFINWLKQYLVFKKVEVRFLQFRIFGEQFFDIFPRANRWTTLYEDNLRQLIQLAKSEKACFLMAQQIMPFDENLSHYLEKNNFDAARKVFSAERANWPELFRQIDLYQIQARIAKETDVPFINFFPKGGPPNSDLFVQNDTVHLSEKGNRYIASNLGDKITTLCPLQ